MGLRGIIVIREDGSHKVFFMTEGKKYVPLDYDDFIREGRRTSISSAFKPGESVRYSKEAGRSYARVSGHGGKTIEYWFIV